MRISSIRHSHVGVQDPGGSGRLSDAKQPAPRKSRLSPSLRPEVQLFVAGDGFKVTSRSRGAGRAGP
jgi:hypothetical protein